MEQHNPHVTHKWARFAVIALTVLVAGCVPRESPVAQPAITRTVDLSHVVREDVPYLPNEPHTQIRRDADGTIRYLQIGARTGTLLRIIAAPGASPATVEQLSPRDLVLPAVVIDVRDRAQDQAGYRFSADELGDWERRNGRVPQDALVLLVTGWDMRWGDPGAYLDLDSAGRSQAPAFSDEVATTLLEERGAMGLGIDAPGTPFMPASGYRLLLENLTNLEQLPPTGATVVVGALKIQAAQTSPARVIALIH